jgi:hypothetical protein
MQLKPGSRWRSAVDETEVIAVRAGSDPIDLRCGGQPMVPIDAKRGDGASPDPMHSDGTQLGKRYADEELGLEVLCTKAGDGSLSIGDEPLLLKDAKPLPSSD